MEIRIPETSTSALHVAGNIWIYQDRRFNMASDREKSSNGRSSGQSKRGFASMDEDKQREIASLGGKAAHEKGTAHEFDSEEAREAGRKGGKAAHEKGTAHEFDSEEAREAGRKGGEARGRGSSHDDSSSSTRAGTSDQHAKGGSQNHKNK
jgi:general stress protein YciG